MGAHAVADTGGIDGASFGAGWAASTAFLSGLGAWLWRVLGKAKDDQIATLVKRIEHLEHDQAEERDRCQRHIDGLNTRIAILEAMTLGGVRQQVQGAVSEIRTEMRTLDHQDGGKHGGGQ